MVLSQADYTNLVRQHVRSAHGWAIEAGTDFWLPGGAGLQFTAGGAHELADYGWTTTSLSTVDGSGADFMESSDKGTPSHILTNASGDILLSPALFGDYTHAELAALVAFGNRGEPRMPRFLVCEFRATFSDASADENQSAIGLFEDGATASTAADQLAVVYSNGVNFVLRSDADSDVGAAVDNLSHRFKIVLFKNGTTYTDGAEWFIDGVSQGRMDIKADEFPAKFGMHVLTTNRILLHWVHIYYDW